MEEKMKMKKETMKEKAINFAESKKQNLYEITMYKLLAMILIGLLISLIIGFYFGSFIGRAKAVDSINVEVPRYCSYDKSMSSINIKCNELSNTTATELCSMLSTSLKSQLKVLIVT